jgi:hypothetical protein
VEDVPTGASARGVDTSKVGEGVAGTSLLPPLEFFSTHLRRRRNAEEDKIIIMLARTLASVRQDDWLRSDSSRNVFPCHGSFGLPVRTTSCHAVHWVGFGCDLGWVCFQGGLIGRCGKKDVKCGIRRCPSRTRKEALSPLNCTNTDRYGVFIEWQCHFESIHVELGQNGMRSGVVAFSRALLVQSCGFSTPPEVIRLVFVSCV